MDIHHRLCCIETVLYDLQRAIAQNTSILLDVKERSQDNHQRLKAGAEVLEKMNKKTAEPLSKKKLTLAALMFLSGILLMTNDLAEITAFLKALGSVLKSF